MKLSLLYTSNEIKYSLVLVLSPVVHFTEDELETETLFSNFRYSLTVHVILLMGLTSQKFMGQSKLLDLQIH